jgi:hypothetical protein
MVPGDAGFKGEEWLGGFFVYFVFFEVLQRSLTVPTGTTARPKWRV